MDNCGHVTIKTAVHAVAQCGFQMMKEFQNSDLVKFQAATTDEIRNMTFVAEVGKGRR